MASPTNPHRALVDLLLTLYGEPPNLRRLAREIDENLVHEVSWVQPARAVADDLALAIVRHHVEERAFEVMAKDVPARVEEIRSVSARFLPTGRVAELAHLLLDLYDRRGLINFARELGEQILNSVPEGAPAIEVAHQIAELVTRSGLESRAFKTMAESRPERADDIRATAALFSFSIREERDRDGTVRIIVEYSGDPTHHGPSKPRDLRWLSALLLLVLVFLGQNLARRAWPASVEVPDLFNWDILFYLVTVVPWLDVRLRSGRTARWLAGADVLALIALALFPARDAWWAVEKREQGWVVFASKRALPAADHLVLVGPEGAAGGRRRVGFARVSGRGDGQADLCVRLEAQGVTEGVLARAWRAEDGAWTDPVCQPAAVRGVLIHTAATEPCTWTVEGLGSDTGVVSGSLVARLDAAGQLAEQFGWVTQAAQNRIEVEALGRACEGEMAKVRVAGCDEAQTALLAEFGTATSSAYAFPAAHGLVMLHQECPLGNGDRVLVAQRLAQAFQDLDRTGACTHACWAKKDLEKLGGSVAVSQSGCGC